MAVSGSGGIGHPVSVEDEDMPVFDGLINQGLDLVRGISFLEVDVLGVEVIPRRGGVRPPVPDCIRCRIKYCSPGVPIFGRYCLHGGA